MELVSFVGTAPGGLQRFYEQALIGCLALEYRCQDNVQLTDMASANKADVADAPWFVHFCCE